MGTWSLLFYILNSIKSNRRYGCFRTEKLIAQSESCITMAKLSIITESALQSKSSFPYLCFIGCCFLVPLYFLKEILRQCPKFAISIGPTSLLPISKKTLNFSSNQETWSDSQETLSSRTCLEWVYNQPMVRWLYI